MSSADLFGRFGVALLLGVMVGIQREYNAEEHAQQTYAGIRTFALMALAGCAGALLSDLYHSPLPLAGTLVIVGLFLAIGYYVDAMQGRTGLTTKTAAILTVLAGALAYHGQTTLAVALGVAVTGLLSVKAEMHRFVSRLTREDILATLKLAVITAIVLPVLPDRNYGPYDVVNPFKIWLFVVFISAIGFVGYVLMKAVGPRTGVRLTGLLGGLTSSTAVTISLTQRSRESSELAVPFASAITTAWTIMFARVAVIVAALSLDLARMTVLPLGAAVLVGAGYCVFLYYREKGGHAGEHVSLSNPFKLGPALKFGLIFTAIMLAAKLAYFYLGNAGTYLSGFLGGLADVDAIALSLTRFTNDPNGLALPVAGRALILACVANTVTKGVVVMVGGSREIRAAILPGWILMILSGIGGIFLV